MKLTEWETECHCNEYGREIGQTIWCFYHKGPHPLDSREGIDAVWAKLRRRARTK